MLGFQQLAILTALLSLKGEATTNELHTQLHGRYSIPSIFLALDRLQKRGLVSSRKGDPLPKRGGRARLHFSISIAGRAALIDAERELRSVVDTITPAIPKLI